MSPVLVVTVEVFIVSEKVTEIYDEIETEVKEDTDVEELSIYENARSFDDGIITFAEENLDVLEEYLEAIGAQANSEDVDFESIKEDLDLYSLGYKENWVEELSDFGDITNGLTRGLVIRKVDGTYQNLVNFKSNIGMKNVMYNFDIQVVANGAVDGFVGRMTLSALGAVIRLGPGEDLQIVVQDDLTSLTEFSIIAEGSGVVD